MGPRLRCGAWLEIMACNVGFVIEPKANQVKVSPLSSLRKSPSTDVLASLDSAAAAVSLARIRLIGVSSPSSLCSRLSRRRKARVS